MGRSFARISKDSVPGSPAAFYHQPSDRHYSLTAGARTVVMRRWQIGFNGKQDNAVEKQVDYVMGSGNHARTYLHRGPDGRLYELPLAWYSENNGFYAMNPGYDRPGHEDFRRRVTYECMFCHNGYPQLSEGMDRAGSDPLFPNELPEGIDCQRCHGPGRDHVRAAEERQPAGRVRESILNPARLDRDRQMEVCMQCHLESTSFPLPHSLRRSERGVFSYDPREPLTNYILHLDHPTGAQYSSAAIREFNLEPGATYDDKFEIAHQAWRLRKSACFEKSGAMTCTTCHNPHDVPRGAAAREHYNKVCSNCHSLPDLATRQRHPNNRDCISCHMPRRRTDDVIHVSMTDHFIQRRPPPGNLLAARRERHLTAETAYKGEVAAYYPGAGSAKDELLLGVAQVKHNTNLEAGAIRLEQAIRSRQPAPAEYYFELGDAYRNQGNLDRAFSYYREAIQRNQNFWPALHAWGTTLAATGRHTEAVGILERAVSAMPTSAASRTHLGLALLESGKVDEAIAALEGALDREPDFAEASNALGGAKLRKGDVARAELLFRQAIRSRPDYAEAHKNLAELLLAREGKEEARWHLSQAVRSDPNFGPAYLLLGDVFAMENRMALAIENYERAVAKLPASAQAHFSLGAALASGNRPEAEKHLRDAVRLQPDYDEAHLNLGILLWQQGRRAEGRQNLSIAAMSSDPAIRATARQFLAQSTR